MRPRSSATESSGAADAMDGFPFNVPAIRTLPELHLTTAVTFFVGENGTGKSTLLEAIAVAAGLPAVGTARRSGRQPRRGVREAGVEGPRERGRLADQRGQEVEALAAAARRVGDLERWRSGPDPATLRELRRRP